MLIDLHLRTRQVHLFPILLAIAVLLSAAYFGHRPSILWLELMTAGTAGLILLNRPVWGLVILVLSTLILPIEFGTGTEVKLNPASLLIPVLLAIWVLDMLGRSQLRLASSPANRPLALFLTASLLSLIIGRATWDPLVPVGGSFLIVQLAQWAIFAFSAGAFWLTANLIQDEIWLRRLTVIFLISGGMLAMLRLFPNLGVQVNRFTTIAFIRAPLWTLLAALAGGQLLWNHRLSVAWKLFLIAILFTGLYYGFFINRESASTWVGIGAALGVLIWLRFPRLRWPLVIIVLLLAFLGELFSAVYEFAGGDDDWAGTGEPRLVLIGRVIEVTMRNPVTGLGPAAYRLYANTKPLIYAHIFWAAPRVSSHNNYVDLFSHGGLLGLALFFWSAISIALLGLRLRRKYQYGFAAGYINGMLAAGAASLILMLFADWILPFVYNIGFPGFQASVLVWLFLGGLVSLDRIDKEAEFRNADCLTPELPAERQ
ncbi:MAG: O-antigen ligase family protein [Caldilineaceae bacterium]|nr:O-antigen ligase family protein [Caldilineaceae bacterium]